MKHKNQLLGLILSTALVAIPVVTAAADTPPPSAAAAPAAPTAPAPSIEAAKPGTAPASVSTTLPAAPPAPVEQPKQAAAPAPTTAPSAPVAAPPADKGAAPELDFNKLKPSVQPFQLMQPSSKIGFVDLARIERESKVGKSAQSKVKAKRDKLQAQITAKQNQLEKQKAEIEAKLPTLSPEERKAKAKEFEKKVEEYRKFVQKADSDLKPLVDEVTKNLSQQIRKAAEAYGKTGGYVAIVPLKDLLFLGSGIVPEDVTDAVLKQMNSKDSKK